MDHIVGVSDLLSRQKAKDQRLKGVTLSKQKQLVRVISAIGIYLRRFVTEHMVR